MITIGPLYHDIVSGTHGVYVLEGTTHWTCLFSFKISTISYHRKLLVCSNNLSIIYEAPALFAPYAVSFAR